MKAYLLQSSDIAQLVLHSPPLNLFDDEMLTDVEAAVRGAAKAAADGAARCMVLRAECPVFCGGVDVREFRDLDPERGARLLARLLDVALAIEALPIPTLAVVHGLNLTIGFELSLACDLIWAADSARFGLVESTVGLTPGAGGTQRIAARAGFGRAAELVFTGGLYDAVTLERWGVVNRVMPGAELGSAADAFSAQLAALPTRAIAAAKQLLRTTRDSGVEAADERTATTVGALFATRDLKHGVESLLECGPGHAQFRGE